MDKKIFLEDLGIKICPKCKHELEFDAVCPKCGYDLEIVNHSNGGGFYRIKGDLQNGAYLQKGQEITRRINSINLEKKMLYCECGREFHINENLTIVRA